MSIVHSVIHWYPLRLPLDLPSDTSNDVLVSFKFFWSIFLLRVTQLTSQNHEILERLKLKECLY